MSYSFRIRFNRAPSNTIETSESQIELPAPAPGISLALRAASSPGESLRNAERWALIGEGYKSEAEASEAGLRMQDALMLALAKVRLGADFGLRTPKGLITNYGLGFFEKRLKVRVLNDVHGIAVYSSEPKPQFIEFNATPSIGKSYETFKRTLTAAIGLGESLTDRERIAFDLFSGSFFQSAADGRFLLLVMAVEALIETEPKSAEAVGYVDRFIQEMQGAPLEERERRSLIGSLSRLRDESINQAGQRLARARLGDRMYANKPAPRFFSDIYDLRSKLAHGKSPAFEEISRSMAPLEQFVSDLLTASLMEAANE